MVFSTKLGLMMFSTKLGLMVFSTKLGLMVYYYEVECKAEKLVRYLQCQGHSEGLYNKNMTVSTIFSKLLVCLQPKLVLIVRHHKPKYPVNNNDNKYG